MTELIPLGEAAHRIGGRVEWRHLNRLANLGKIPIEKAGHIKLVRVADLDAIRAKCREAGYLREEPARA